MTTAAAAPTEIGEYFDRIAVASIQASPTNPRTHFDDAYITELAGSIAEKGLIQPIILRPLPSGKFEVVAGECRYRATKRAGLDDVPAIVREYSDEQVLEVQLIENIHRTDLTPLEQAVGYRRLIDANPTKHSAETIATRIGMSVAYVWDRLKLNDLIPEAKALLEAERIGIGHGILISRLKPANQTRVIKPDDARGYGPRNDSGLWVHESARLDLDEEDDGKASKLKRSPYDGFKPKSVRELDAWIQRHIRFDVEHAAKAVPLQFEQTAIDVKHATALPGRGRKVISITNEYRVADDARDQSERTYGSGSWERADGAEKSKTCDHSVLGVFVAGPGYGTSRQVCVARDKCRVHFGKAIAEREKNQKLRESGKGKQATRNEKKQQESYEARWKREDQERKRVSAAWEAVRPRALEAVAAVLKKAGPNRLVLDALMKTVRIYHKADQELFAKLMGKVTADNIAVAVLFGTIVDDASRNFAEFQRCVKPFNVDLKALEAEYKTAATPPKAEKPATPAKSAKGKKR